MAARSSGWLPYALAFTASACHATAPVHEPTPIPISTPIAPFPVLPVAPFADSFIVIMPGADGAWRRHSLEHTSTGYRFVEEYRFAPNRYRTTEITLSPSLKVEEVRSHGQTPRGPVDLEVVYIGHRVRGWSVLPDSAGTHRLILDNAVPDSAIDVLALMAVLPGFDWHVGATYNVIEFQPEGPAARREVLTVVGEDKVTVPAGTFDTFRAELTLPADKRILWYTQSLPHRLVRVASTTHPWSTDLVTP